jgi:hypothetical protein
MFYPNVDVEGTLSSISSATTFSCAVNQFVGADVLRRVGVGFQDPKENIYVLQFYRNVRYISVADPYSLFTNPDPAFQLNTSSDPVPGF